MAAGVAQAPAASPAAGVAGGSFQNILGQAIDSLNGVTNNATSVSLDAAAGTATVADATVASSVATFDTQLASALVSRAVSSLNSIMNMPL